MDRTRRSASRWLRACTPDPSTASVLASARASTFVAAADVAAVRISVMSRPQVEVLAGINLPMLVKLAKVRDECPLQEAVLAAQDAGRKYVTIASRVLSGK